MKQRLFFSGLILFVFIFFLQGCGHRIDMAGKTVFQDLNLRGGVKVKASVWQSDELEIRVIPDGWRGEPTSTIPVEARGPEIIKFNRSERAFLILWPLKLGTPKSASFTIDGSRAIPIHPDWQGIWIFKLHNYHDGYHQVTISCTLEDYSTQTVATVQHVLPIYFCRDKFDHWWEPDW